MTNLVRARGIVAVSQAMQGRERGLTTAHVADDLRKIQKSGADVLALQGMDRWRYWFSLMSIYDKSEWGRWPRYPLDKGSGEPILWKTERYDFVDGHTRLLHPAVPKLTRDIYSNYVLLRDKESGLCFWVRNSEYVESHMHRKQPDPLRVKTWMDTNANDRLFLREAMDDGNPALVFGMYHRYFHAVLGTEIRDRTIRYVGPRLSDYSILCNNDHGAWYLAQLATLPWENYNSQHTGRLLRLNIMKKGEGA